ncbi:hypothetical protein J2W17_005905 [Pseudomonas lini]|nr:hypothetical protein [Pseudomonas lini]
MARLTGQESIEALAKGRTARLLKIGMPELMRCTKRKPDTNPCRSWLASEGVSVDINVADPPSLASQLLQGFC